MSDSSHATVDTSQLMYPFEVAVTFLLRLCNMPAAQLPTLRTCNCPSRGLLEGLR